MKRTCKCSKKYAVDVAPEYEEKIREFAKLGMEWDDQGKDVLKKMVELAEKLVSHKDWWFVEHLLIEVGMLDQAVVTKFLGRYNDKLRKKNEPESKKPEPKHRRQPDAAKSDG